MIIGPKYKIARRLGAPVFEKTQTQKYALHLEKRGKTRGFSKPKSEYGLQLNEKQKARFTYALTEKQFSKYVREALLKKSSNASQVIFEALELRLDNIIYRLGFSSTRLGARQMVSHGHISVNGRRVNTPSMKLRVGDKLEIAERSKNKPLFVNFDEKVKNAAPSSWLKLDAGKRVAEVVSNPVYVKTENMFDLNTVVEYYSR
jgi:small subunit ribosomal protein S4